MHIWVDKLVWWCTAYVWVILTFLPQFSYHVLRHEFDGSSEAAIHFNQCCRKWKGYEHRTPTPIKNRKIRWPWKRVMYLAFKNSQMKIPVWCGTILLVYEVIWTCILVTGEIRYSRKSVLRKIEIIHLFTEIAKKTSNCGESPSRCTISCGLSVPYIPRLLRSNFPRRTPEHPLSNSNLKKKSDS